MSYRTESSFPKGPAIRIAAPEQARTDASRTPPVRVERPTGDYEYKRTGNIDKTLSHIVMMPRDPQFEGDAGPDNTLTTPNTGGRRK